MGSARPARREPKNPKSCHERALGLLAVRPRSRRELERRLLQAGFEPEEVQDTLGRLTSPIVGFTPTSPLQLDGDTIDPSVSLPIAAAHRLAATATADPELEPDALRSSA